MVPGFGLSIISGLARAPGGGMTVESVQNEGTQFFVDLPFDTG